MKFTHTMSTIVSSGGGGGRTYGFDLELIKSPSASSCSTGSSSSLPTSTISESSSPPLAISTKRARTPRKRPNQSYTEAAALLSTICPNLFSTNKLSKHSKPFSSHLLPPSPPPFLEHGFLIQYPSPDYNPSSSPRFQFKPPTPTNNSQPCSPASPSNYDYDYDYDVESILDEEVVGEEIDSIMGNLCMGNSYSNSASNVNPHFGSLLGLGIGGGGGGKLELGFGFGFGLVGGRNNIHQALRGARTAEWWRPTTAVSVQEILPGFNSLTPSPNKKTKKKKKKKKDEGKGKGEAKGIKNDVPTVRNLATIKTAAAETIATTTTSNTSTTTTTAPLEAELKSGLGLKLNHEDVLKAWSDHEYPFSNETGATESSADIIARLAEIDLFPDNEGGGVREASVQRYREKRRTRLFSKKIRYQVRKVNADRRPRMKASGRFVKRPDLLQEALEEESQ